jgi:hypothetical protein
LIIGTDSMALVGLAVVVLGGKLLVDSAPGC